MQCPPSPTLGSNRPGADLSLELPGPLCLSVLVDVLVGSDVDVDVDADVDADDAVVVGTVVGADVDVVVGDSVSALSPPSWQTPHEDLKLFSFGSSPVLRTPAEKTPLSTRKLSSFCYSDPQTQLCALVAVLPSALMPSFVSRCCLLWCWCPPFPPSSF